MNSEEGYVISSDAERLNIPFIHTFLASSYWARDIPLSLVEHSLKNSLCFGAYHQGSQVAFARVVTDYATFAYLADVFVIPEHRGKGVSKLLMKTILAHSELQGLRRFLLATQDAQGLYAQFGFKPLSDPEHYMTIHRPDMYRKGSLI